VTTFYVVSAGAAATLVGLLFVAVQIGPPLNTGGPVARRHAMARSTFTIFTLVFGVSLFFVLPGTPARARALVAVAAALTGAYRAVVTWLPVWKDKFRGRIEFRLWQTAWLLIGPLLAYAYLAYGGFQQMGARDPAVIDSYVTSVFIVLFIVGLRNTWDLLVEGTRPQDTAG
jgi:hypothetical protein